MFYEKGEIKDKEEIINGEKTTLLKEMLNQIDWDRLSQGTPVNFHGDFQPENILICDKGFQLIDWRHNFAGNVDYGDIYYDFAKLNHGLIICHELVNKELYEVKHKLRVVDYDFLRKSSLVECELYFRDYIKSKGFDYEKVDILTALIFLNIAALHHYPYSSLLFYLGKSRLYNCIKENIFNETNIPQGEHTRNK